MERIETFLSAVHIALNTKHKRHIAGGILLSVSLLFGVLAITAMSLKEENDEKL